MRQLPEEAAHELERGQYALPGGAGSRIAQILELAIDESREVRARAEAEAEEIRSVARAQWQEILMSARGAAEETAALARRERQRALDEIQGERDRAISDIKAERERSRRELAEPKARNDAPLGDRRRLRHAPSAANEEIHERDQQRHTPVRPFGNVMPSDVTTIAISEPLRRALEQVAQSAATGHRTSQSNSIEVVELVREFKGLRAVDGIDLHVDPGEIYGFLGPNGAGKSTTVQVLTTLLAPTRGRVAVGGFDVTRQGAMVRAVIGAALQEAALDPMLTGREHLKLQATLHGFRRRDRNLRADELLDRIGLADAADRRVDGYSGGMKRRLDLALALVHRPRVLFLDEPTTGLDPQSRTALWEEVERLSKDEGVTVFLTTQYLEEADVLADRVAFIDHGRIVAEGTPTELKAEIGRPKVEVVPGSPGAVDALRSALSRFGEPYTDGHGRMTVQLPGGDAQLPEVVRALDEAAVRLEALHLHAPTLDDVFVAKTGRKLEGAGDSADSGD